jgi:hypothetical protein
MIELTEEAVQYTPEQAFDHLKTYVNKISKRYTKHYEEAFLSENFFL